MAVTPDRFLKCCHENLTKETNMTTPLTTQRTGQILLIILITICCRATLAVAASTEPEAGKAETQYHVSNLRFLGGTSSGGNSINDQSWAAGYSRLPE